MGKVKKKKFEWASTLKMRLNSIEKKHDELG